MNCFPVTVVLVAVTQTLLGAVLSGHMTDSQEVEENLIVSKRRAISEHDHRTDDANTDILGIKEDSADIKDLNPSEIKQRLKSVLEIMDHNKNGFIELNELVEKLLKSYKKLSIEESDLEFQISDVDEDGYVTWEEYIGDTFNNPDENDDDDDDDVAKEEREIFDAADFNKDGKLCITEFRRFYTPEDHDSMKSILVSGVMSRFDTNNDGKITFEEFTGSRRFEHDSKWIEEEKYTFENNLDIDKNGVLEGDELYSWASPSNSQIAESEAENLIKKADKNSDGVLSYDEVLDNHTVFTSPDSEGHYLFKDEL